MLTKRRLARALFAQMDRIFLQLANRCLATHHLECNACHAQTVGYFVFEGRPDGCPQCSSFSRERFVLLALDSGLIHLPMPGGRILHIAPTERHLRERFRQQHEYLAGDLAPGFYGNLPILKVDLTAIDRNPKLAGVDLLYASHVLEHIPNDGKALNAIYNTLRPSGEAWFLVPLRAGTTIEEDYPLSSREREKRFGQWDHVRYYGSDIRERFSRVGFEVQVIDASCLPLKKVERAGIQFDEKIFVCKRPMASTTAPSLNLKAG